MLSKQVNNMEVHLVKRAKKQTKPKKTPFYYWAEIYFFTFYQYNSAFQKFIGTCGFHGSVKWERVFIKTEKLLLPSRASQAS